MRLPDMRWDLSRPEGADLHNSSISWLSWSRCSLDLEGPVGVLQHGGGGQGLRRRQLVVGPLVGLRLLLPLLLLLLQPRRALGPRGAARVVIDTFFAVSPHVFPHIPGLYESLLAHRADMVPLPRVSGRVPLQMRLLHEGLSTIGADELLFTLVISQVVLENRMAPELLVTLCAAVPLLTSVKSDMGLQVSFLGETFSTECTEECLLYLHVLINFVVP